MSRLIENEKGDSLQLMSEEHIKKNGGNPHEELWVNSKRAQDILGIKQTQLYLIRTNPKNKIVFSQPNRKNIMYLKKSLYEYLERHIR